MILSDVLFVLQCFKPAFRNTKTFQLFVAVMVGFLSTTGNKHLTTLCHKARQTMPAMMPRYSSFCKFFSRRRWNVIKVMNCFLTMLLMEFSDFRIVIDATSTTTQGRKQDWRHYRLNSHYRRSYDNQSKYLAGNSVLSVALIGIVDTPVGQQSFTFPLGAVLINTKNKRHNERNTAVRTIGKLDLKPSIVIADKLYSDAHSVNRLRRQGHTLITRLRANAVFFSNKECTKKLSMDHCREESRELHGHKVYRSTLVCFRRRLKASIRVVRDRWYNRRKKQWKHQYYCSTDVKMGADEIVNEYKRRTNIEHGHQDVKSLAGFNDCRLRSVKSIEGFLSLSLLSIGIIEWLRYRTKSQASTTTKQMIDQLDLHWYKPMGLTRGIIQRFLNHQMEKSPAFVAKFWTVQNLALAVGCLFSTS